MLQLDQVMVRQGEFVLKIDLDVAAGGRLAIMGASGSGKSTLLNLIAGFVMPDAGRVLINGVDVRETPIAERPVSVLFQDGNLFPHLSIYQNVALGIRPDLRLAPDQRVQVEESLEKVGLGGMGQRKPADLSGGQQSRAAIARILLRDKPLLLLDEPFAALDPGLRQEMLVLLNALCVEKGLTLLMVSHDMRDARQLCDQLCLLSDGIVALSGDMATLLHDPPAILAPWL